MSTRHRIHVLGASGSGTSTLAHALASALSSQAFDSDDFYWRPTDPPFTEKRPIAERVALMESLFLPRADWVLSGSFIGWGNAVTPRLTHVVFVTLPAGARLARLRARERSRYGAQIDPGGARAVAYRSFLDWAMAYEDPNFSGRSRRAHEMWLDELTCPVTRVDGLEPVAVLTAQIRAALDQNGGAA